MAETANAHSVIRAKVPADLLTAATRYENTDDNWPEARNALFEMTAEGAYTKAALRDLYRTEVAAFRAGTGNPDHHAAYAVLIAEASLYAREGIPAAA